jgi:hypothetical protein
VPCFAGETAGDAAVFGEAEGELDVFGVVCALSAMGRARLATQQMPIRFILFLINFPDFVD